MDCNNDCLFCSVPKKDLGRPLKEIKNKIDEYKRQGFEQVTLTGGEPTLHPHLIEIIKYIKSKNMACRLVTNGTNINLALIKKLVLVKVDYIAFSIHSLDPKHSKYISDNIDYDIHSILKFVDYIINKTPIYVYWNTTFSRLNYKELPSMAKVISSRFPNVHLVNFNFVDIWGNVFKKELQEQISLKYSEAEYYFIKSFEILKKNKIPFRAERIPLCYLVGYENYSSDFNRIMLSEEPQTDFIEDGIRKLTTCDYRKGKDCNVCKYNRFCLGVSHNYAKHYGLVDIYPVFHTLPRKFIK